jgi:hypothetical protein
MVRVSSTRVTYYDFLLLQNRLPARSRDLGNWKTCPSPETWRFIFMFTRDHHWVFPESDESSPHFHTISHFISTTFLLPSGRSIRFRFSPLFLLAPSVTCFWFNHDNYLATCSNLWEYPSGRDVKGLQRLQVRIPREGMNVCPLWVTCFDTQRSLWQPDHSSRGFRPSMVCLSVVEKPHRRGISPRLLSNHEKKKLRGLLTHWGRGHLNCLNARSRGF